MTVLFFPWLRRLLVFGGHFGEASGGRPFGGSLSIRFPSLLGKESLKTSHAPKRGIKRRPRKALFIVFTNSGLSLGLLAFRFYIGGGLGQPLKFRPWEGELIGRAESFGAGKRGALVAGRRRGWFGRLWKRPDVSAIQADSLDPGGRLPLRLVHGQAQ